MTDKIYCGNGREKNFNNGGSIINVTVDLDTLIREFDNYGFTTEQGKRKVKLIVGQRREIDQYGNSHHITIDTWKPDGSGNTTATPEPPKSDGSEFEEFADDVPI